MYPRERAEAALQNFFRVEKLAALRELALREVAEDVESRRGSLPLDPLSQQAVAERVLVLVTPDARSQRILRRAWRSAERLGAEIDALWVRKPGQKLMTKSRPRRRRCAGSRSCWERISSRKRDDLLPTVKRIVSERGSTYVFVGTPDESRRREILRGSLVSALVRELPGVDVRVVANRAERKELSQ